MDNSFDDGQTILLKFVADFLDMEEGILPRDVASSIACISSSAIEKGYIFPLNMKGLTTFIRTLFDFGRFVEREGLIKKGVDIPLFDQALKDIMETKQA